MSNSQEEFQNEGKSERSRKQEQAFKQPIFGLIDFSLLSVFYFINFHSYLYYSLSIF